MVARGHTVMEVLVAMAVLVIIATCVTAGDHGQRAALLGSLQELQDSRRAASVLERLRADRDTITPGTVSLDDGERTIRRLEPHLYEVRVRVGKTHLVTWLTAETK